MVQEPLLVGRQAEEVVLVPKQLDGPLVDGAQAALEQIALGVVALARDAVEALVVVQVDVVTPVAPDGVQ